MIRGVVAGLAVLACAACSTTPHPAAPASAAPASATAEPIAVQLDTPTHLTYPAVGVDADVEPTGLNPDGTIHVPALDHAGEVDYLAWAPALIATRPIVLISHRNGRNPNGSIQPGGFGHLPDAKVGDTLTVDTAAGAAVKWRVTTVHNYAKTAFPTSIYNPTTAPTLLLITCVGNVVNHDYQSNEVVAAVPA